MRLLSALGLCALLSITSLSQTAVPIRLASADSIEGLFASRVATTNVNVPSLERQAFVLVNREREKAGLKPLEWSDQLEGVARVHSDNMAQFQFFSHKGLDNKYVSDRADAAHVGDWQSIGENIAFSKGYADPVALTLQLWLDSPSHKQNMLNEKWQESAIGVGVAEDGAYYFTQVFLLRK